MNILPLNTCKNKTMCRNIDKQNSFKGFLLSSFLIGLFLIGVVNLSASLLHNSVKFEFEDKNIKKNLVIDIGFDDFVPCTLGSGKLGGRITGDFNYDGQADDGLVGLPGVLISIYGCDENGNSVAVATTMSDSEGHYEFAGLSDGEQYRLEVDLPSHLQELKNYYEGGYDGVNDRSWTQNVTVPNCEINVGFASGFDYHEDNPIIVAACYVNGDPISPNPSADDSNNPAYEKTIVMFNWDDEGSVTTPTGIADAEETGSVYGMGYNRYSKKIYTSAFIKRHVGLGPLGIGGIYEIDVTDPFNPVYAEFLDVENIGIDVGNISDNVGRGLQGSLSEPSNDAESFEKVASEGIGALAIDELNNVLYFVNLFNKRLYAIEIDSDNDSVTAPTAADVLSFGIPVNQCTNGEFRPFAITIERGQVYVGGVCDGSQNGSVTDMSAYVYKLNKLTGTFSQEAWFSLDYAKGYAANENLCDNNPGWYPWRSDLPAGCSGTTTQIISFPTPVLSDIGFDADGSMIVAFMDRMGHQIGYRNYPLVGTSPLYSSVSGGDILRLEFNESGYTLESNGSVGGFISGGANNNQGPGGGEFYFMDIFAGPDDNVPTPPHVETTQGDIAFYPGSGMLISISMDPYSTLFNSGGVNYFSNKTGEARTPGYVLYQSITNDITNFSKGNGLGGLIALASEAPIVLGGHTWRDDNEDGIQDGCEPRMNGVNVSLYQGDGTHIANTITDSNGKYSFINENLEPNSEYYIVFGTYGQFDRLDGIYDGSLYITTRNTGMGTFPERNDSDSYFTDKGLVTNEFAVYPSIEVQTGSFGYSNFDLDMGFAENEIYPISGLAGYVFHDIDSDGIQESGEVPIEQVSLQLFNSNDLFIEEVTTDESGYYYFYNIPEGDFYILIDASTNSSNVNYVLSASNQGSDDSLDSDFETDINRTVMITHSHAIGSQYFDAALSLPSGMITGHVFLDVQGLGTQDGFDSNITNVQVNLFEEGNSSPILSTFTDNDGNYVFTGVMTGQYYISFDEMTNDQGFSDLDVVPMDQGGDDNLDSDINPITKSTIVFDFDALATPTLDFDAGFLQRQGTITGYAFEDNNDNGVQDQGDIALENVSVLLYDSSDNEVASTFTDVNGEYSFINVTLGVYYIVFNPTTNTTSTNSHAASSINQGNDDSIDSDINTLYRVSAFAFDPDVDLEYDAGFAPIFGSITGLAFYDADGDGIRDGSEPMLSSVEVNLYNSNDMLIGSTTTDQNGNYNFENIFNGEFYLRFIPNPNAYSNYFFSPQGVGDNSALDSDVDGSGTTSIITYESITGTPITNIDAGLIFNGAEVNGVLWVDCNNNGIRENSESLISNTQVILIGNDIANNPINHQTLSDNNGNFSFVGLVEGNYQIQFSIPITISGLVYTQINEGIDELIDSDANPNTGTTNLFSLSTNEIFSDFSAGYIDDEDPVFVNPPVDTYTSCDNLDFGEPNMFSATDNLDNDVFIDYNEIFENINGNCSGLTVTRTWTAYDDCGNSSLYTQILSATDHTAPTITLTNPILIDVVDNDTLFFDCNDLIPVLGVADAEVSDICDANPSLIFEDFLITEGNCEQNGFLRQMYCGWIAEDQCGNRDTFDIYLVIQDNEAPEWIGTLPLNDIHLTCVDEIPLAPEITILDNCDEFAQLDYSEVIIGEECDLQKIIRKWTAIDHCGNENSHQYSIFIDTPDFEFIGIPDDLTVDCIDDIQDPNVSINQECHNTDIEYEEIYIGEICNDYEIVRRWSASNDCGQSHSEQYTITVLVNELEILGVPEDVTVNCDEVPDPITPTTTDACYEVSLTYNEVIVNHICTDHQLIRTWTAIDECGNEVQESQTINVFTQELELVGVPEDITINCSDPLPPIANPTPITDCYDVEVDYGETIIGDTCENYKILRVWVANDECSNQVMEMQTIIVLREPISLTNLAQDFDLECDQIIPEAQDPIAYSPCSEVTINYQENIIPGSCPENYSIQRHWIANDDCGHTLEHVQIIEIIDTTAPELVINHPELMGVPSGSTLIYDCSELVNFQDAITEAFDNCVEDPLDVEFIETVVEGSCADDGYILDMNCCWQAIDPCGNLSEYCINIVITDSEQPSLIGVPSDIVVNLANGDTIPNLAEVSATDACFDPVLEVVESSFALECGYTLVRTWIAEDHCGNVSSATQEITIQDVCDCPDIVLGNIDINNAHCNGNGGSILIETGLSESVYEYTLIPNYGDSNLHGNEVTDLPPGSYLMIVDLPNVEDCDEKIYFDIIQEGCNDFVTANITSGQSEYCLDESVFDFEGTITSSDICYGGNSESISISSVDNNCMDLFISNGFTGLSQDEICVIHCFNGNLQNCDTTYILFNVQSNQAECQLDITNIQIEDENCGLNNGAISFDVVGNEGTLQYQWNIPDINTNFTNELPAGVYYVTITDLNSNCNHVESFNIDNSTNIEFDAQDITVSGTTCSGDNDGSIVSNTDIEYQILNASTGIIGFTPQQGLQPGVYSVRHSIGDCQENIQVVVEDNDDLSANAQIHNESCNMDNGSIQLTILGGLQPYNYFWSPNVSTTSFAENLSLGSYSVTIMDAGGCTEIIEDLQVNETFNPQISLSDISIQHTSCGNDNGAISSNTAVQYQIFDDQNQLLGTTPLQALASASYTIFDPNSPCADMINVTINDSQTLMATYSTSNETCQTNDGIINITIMEGTFPYTYTWWPDVSESSTQTNLTAGIYSITVEDAAGCIQAIDNIQITNDCTECNFSYTYSTEDVLCKDGNNGFIEILTADTYNYDWSHDNNLNLGGAYGLVAGSYSVTITIPNTDCESIDSFTIDEPLLPLEGNVNYVAESCAGNDGSITLNISGGTAPYTYSWLPNVSDQDIALNLTEGSYTVTVTDDNNCEVIYIDMNVVNDCNLGCTDFINTEQDYIQGEDCTLDLQYCMPIPFLDALNYEVTIDGFSYSGDYIGCDFANTTIYEIESIPGNGNQGPYSLVDWEVNGNFYNASFNSIAELVAIMNTFDPNDNWYFDMASNSIRNIDSEAIYGTLNIIQIDSNQSTTISFEEVDIPRMAQINVPAGEHELVFTRLDDCKDSIHINAFCLTTEIVDIVVPQGGTQINCLDNSELPGNPISINIVCQNCTNSTVTLNDDDCAVIQGNNGGSDLAQLIVCDDLGYCDTTIYLITVVGNLNGPPTAENDAFSTPMNTPIQLKVIENDIFMGQIANMNIQRMSENALLTIDSDNTILFQPNEDFCGEETFVYEICDIFGCDDASVIVQVLCNLVQPVTGFSPNGDGFNESFVIQGLEDLENYSLAIFDRRGLKVFQSTDYHNDWKGTYSYVPLPSGTYFYLIEHNQGTISGYVQIMR